MDAKPFTAVPDMIITTDKLTQSEKLVILSLLQRLANRKTPTAVSVRGTARNWGLGHTKVQRQMEWFINDGFLIRSDNKATEGTHKYTLDLDKLAGWLHGRGVLPPRRGVAPVSQGGGSHKPPSIPPRPSLRETLPNPHAREEELSEGGTGRGLSHPKTEGNVYVNKRDGRCTECSTPVPAKAGKILIGPDGALCYCKAHIIEAKAMWMRERTKLKLIRAQAKHMKL